MPIKFSSKSKLDPWLYNSVPTTAPVKPSKYPQKMFDLRSLIRAKSIVFSAIMLTAVFFIAYSDTLLTFDVKRPSGGQMTRKPKFRFLQSTTSSSLKLRSINEEFDRVIDVEDSSLHPLVSPLNGTEEERIQWLQKNLGNFDIFKSDNLTQMFHARVTNFFSRECSAQFFMTWISLASSFGRREFLCIESLFKAHPHGCLVIVSRTMDSSKGHNILKPFMDLGFRVLAVTPDMPQLLKETPADSWFDELRNGSKDPGEIPLAQNLSNLIRLAVLYKYGGVYLDADFIVLKDFSRLKNSIGAQSVDRESGNWTRLNNAVMIFDRHHPLLHKFMVEFALTFDGNKWGHNGPYLVSRVVERIQARNRHDSDGDFTVLSPMAFYPVGWTRIDGWFKKPENRGDAKWVEAKIVQLSGKTYGVHLWNKQSQSVRIEEGSIIGRLVSEHCVICQSIYTS